MDGAHSGAALLLLLLLLSVAYHHGALNPHLHRPLSSQNKEIVAASKQSQQKNQAAAKITRSLGQNTTHRLEGGLLRV